MVMYALATIPLIRKTFRRHQTNLVCW
jgi:hypothetical protein